MKFSSFDILPNQIIKNKKIFNQNEFDQIEFEWSRLKLLIPINKTEENDELQLDIHSKLHTCELNSNTFKRIIEIYDKNIQFLQQLKDKHLVRLSRMNKTTSSFFFIG
jgi:hypothetical protein